MRSEDPVSSHHDVTPVDSPPTSQLIYSKRTDLTYFEIELIAFRYHNGDIIVMGDFNIDFKCKLIERRRLVDVFTFMQSCPQHIILHIQIRHLAFTSNDEEVVSCEHLSAPGASHHHIIFVGFDVKHTKIQRPPTPWLTQSITQLIRKRGFIFRLFKHARKSNSMLAAQIFET
ncbi:hypothetical protein PR048_031063 [Dryococelus australis]|uniref:Uncharacterized protein n=1 Tax=Dryococelus australis TaxID=614101 RepID=A0ABQ9G472_9NEOP|nr:hypothetical protein PR048_031063 [Dryococelus australis]